MSKPVRNLVSLVGLLAVALAAVSMWAAPIGFTGSGASGIEGLLFWGLLTTAATMFPVQTSRGPVVSVFVAPLLACAFLGGPTAGAVVGLFGTVDMRELRGQVPWYGTVYNHSIAVIGAVVAGWTYHWLSDGIAVGPMSTLVGAIAGGVAYFVVQEFLSALALSVRQGRPLAAIVSASFRDYGLSLLGLVPLAWLMALAYEQVWYAVALIFAIPLYTTRAAYQSVVEIRKMFTQTIKALASAIDARDPSTKKHSENVSTIAMEIGQELAVSESDMEKLQWGGLLHDVGKIGIPDAVLLKPGRLNKEERMAMNTHPEKGRDILLDVEALQPILPIILHHHQWYNGSGYPKVSVGETDRALIGEEIPLLARILHVADAFEAMTAVRPYRPNPMSSDKALDELRKYSGIQFDPRVVDAFARTYTAQGGWPRPAEPEPLPTPSIPMIGQVAKLRGAGSTPSVSSVTAETV